MAVDVDYKLAVITASPGALRRDRELKLREKLRVPTQQRFLPPLLRFVDAGHHRAEFIGCLQWSQVKGQKTR